MLSTGVALAAMPGVGGAADDESRVGPRGLRTFPSELVRIDRGAGDRPTRVGVKARIAGESAATETLVTATFQITYAGFTAEAQAAFQAAADVWAGLISTPVPIKVNATWSDAGDPLNLGSAGPNYLLAGFANSSPTTYYAAPLANALAGVDLITSTDRADVPPGSPSNTGNHDINANFNSVGPDWYFALDGNPAPGQSDLFTVVLHELGHGLGMLKGFRFGVTGASEGSWIDETNDYWLRNDAFAEDLSGTDLLTIAHPSVALGSALTTGQVFMNGTRANRGARNLTRPELYTPSGWSGGSSMSHLDETVFGPGNPNSLMTPFLSGAEAIHVPGPIILGHFADLGWTALQVPNVPTAVTGVPGNRRVALRWTPPVDTGGSAITGYTVTTLQGGVPFGSPVNVPGNATTRVIPGLTNGTTYTFTVAATNAIGPGPDSATSLPVVPALRPFGDYDGDGDTELSIRRPSSKEWFVRGASPEGVVYGLAGDIPVPGDYDANGTTDVAVYRPSDGMWYRRGASPEGVRFGGVNGDVPVPGDYDGDGDTDRAIWRPSTHTWFVDGVTGLAAGVSYGLGTDVPVPGDYDADGDTDIALYRPSTGDWFVRGAVPEGIRYGGVNGDIPVPGDYDNDGDTDLAIRRPSSREWFVRGASPEGVVYGLATDVPLPGDFNADGRTDIALFRPSNGDWYVRGATPEGIRYGTISGDTPLYLPYAIRKVYFPSL